MFIDKRIKQLNEAKNTLAEEIGINFFWLNSMALKNALDATWLHMSKLSASALEKSQRILMRLFASHVFSSRMVEVGVSCRGRFSTMPQWSNA